MGLDETVLEQLRKIGGEALVQQLFRLYVEHTPDRLRRVRQGLASRDPVQVAKALHSLRSSSATLGAGELVELLAELEARADRGALREVAERWPALESRISDLVASLTNRLGEA